MIVGCYTLELYCEVDEQRHFQDSFAQYVGKNERECLRNARRDGWKVDKKKWQALCPKHRGVTLPEDKPE